ncbi:hypothetical protein N7457_003142 [Penicillium paradoxum]|uniref:uncharacterized protein n=1 Tax=Penicillium paradoxum TaxID=176176 RepID=UPI002548F691|nr:uncharacterized protein N7457_003142 [Penicillium paradoxum]KAJ5788152.1 hypothetical protein N7457_003142 [Penicillium paradoxum]
MDKPAQEHTMANIRPKLLPKERPSEPRNHLHFDPWQSASTGHQRAAESGGFIGSTSWRDARAAKLTRQYQSGDCLARQRRGSGNTTIKERSLAPGAFDGKCASPSPPRASGEWVMLAGEEAKRNELGVRDIRSFMGVGKRKATDGLEKNTHLEKKMRSIENESQCSDRSQAQDGKGNDKSQITDESQPESRSGAGLDLKSTSDIFAGVTIFINGSTVPRISEYKLKHLLAANGAKTSIYMARKTVTHVLVGQPNTGTGSGMAVSGAGGGLAAGKLQQEIARGGWKGVKVVSVDWVLESIKAGRRLAESRFPGMHVATKGQRSVAGMFGLQGVKK